MRLVRDTDGKGYDYSVLPEDDRDAILLHAIKIKLYAAMTTNSASAIGLQLVEAKGRLPHGQFGKWLAAEFAWSDRTARQYMAVYRYVEAQESATDAETNPFSRDELDNFDLSAIYRLVELDVPPALKQFAFDMVKDGQRVARRLLDEKLAEMRPAAVPSGRDRRPLTDTRATPAPSPDRQAGPTRGDNAEHPADGTTSGPTWAWPSLHVRPGSDDSAKAFAARLPAKDLEMVRDRADDWGLWLDSLVVYIDERLAVIRARSAA